MTLAVRICSCKTSMRLKGTVAVCPHCDGGPCSVQHCTLCKNLTTADKHNRKM